jgi:hypothetical protein
MRAGAIPLHVSRALPRMVLIALLSPLLISLPAAAQDDARMRQLRLLCAQLSGDLTDPGGIAAFRRCLTTHNPIGEIKRDNGIGGGGHTGGGGGGAAKPVADRPGATPPKGFGRETRTSLADGVQSFTTADGKTFFAVDKDGKLWRWQQPNKDAYVVDDHVASAQVVDDGHVLVLSANGDLWLEPNIISGRVQVDAKATAFQPLGDAVFVLGSDGKLWREAGSAANRALIDQQVARFRAFDGGQIFVLGSDGKLRRENGDARDRKELASMVVAFQYVPDGDTLYVLTKDADLWRQERNEKGELVDKNVAAFQAVDMHMAFVLSRDGRLWRELGNRDQSLLVDNGVDTASDRSSFAALDAQHVYVLGTDRKLWAEMMPAGR